MCILESTISYVSIAQRGAMHLAHTCTCTCMSMGSSTGTGAGKGKGALCILCSLHMRIIVESH